jgi:hypothetical protein
MSSFSCLVRSISGSGQVRYRLGEQLVRPLSGVRSRAVPAEHSAGSGFRLEGVLRGDWENPVGVTVVQLADRESGLSARTIARRLSSVSDRDRVVSLPMLRLPSQ